MNWTWHAFPISPSSVRLRFLSNQSIHGSYCSWGWRLVSGLCWELPWRCCSNIWMTASANQRILQPSEISECLEPFVRAALAKESSIQGKMGNLVRVVIFAIVEMILLGSFCTPNIHAQTSTPWSTMGPSGATVLSLKQDPFNSQVLFAGTLFGGIYKTVNRGSSWSQVTSPFNSTSVFSIAPDPSNNGTIYVGTQGVGVCQSTDDGNTWVVLSQGLTDTTVLAVTVNPFNRNSLLAATGTGIFTSANAGALWTLSTAAAPPSQVKTFVYDPKNSGTVYAGTQCSGA